MTEQNNWEKLADGFYRYKKDAALTLQDQLSIDVWVWKICYLFDTHGAVENLSDAMKQAEKWYNHKFEGLIK